MFGLLDCNNFYASCERVFNPKLVGKPIIILSNNDGCIIARSNEAKALGLPMGAPVHEWKDLIDRNNVRMFSANFELYGDISHRIIDIIKHFVPNIEVYSIDEAFLLLHEINEKEYIKICSEIRKTIKKWTGIPVSIGIANTKTLAKFGNRIAKKNPEFNGVCFLENEEMIDFYLNQAEVIDIWGVGRQSSLTLNKNGIYTALQLKNTDERIINHLMNIVSRRTVLELRGTPCIELEHHELRKTIMSSRSFRKAVVRIEDLKEAISTFTIRAAEKLIEQNAVASRISVSIRTDKHAKSWYSYDGYEKKLDIPTSYLPDLIKAANECLYEIHNPQLGYKKAAVVLSGILKADSSPIGLFEKQENFYRNRNLMKAFYEINNKFGSATIQIGSAGMLKLWRGKRELVTKRYTTDWEEVMRI